jgi:hypothetical protein
MTNIHYKSDTVVGIKYSTFVFIPIVIKVDIKLYKVASVAVNSIIYVILSLHSNHISAKKSLKIRKG